MLEGDCFHSGCVLLMMRGNLKYDYYIPLGGDDLLLVEKWRDADALRLHAETPHYAKLKELKPQHVTETVVERFETAD